MVFKSIQEDISAFMARDPAARSRLEIVVLYPGFHALMIYRLASALWRRRLFLIARLLSHVGRLLTGIEIHPGARIGRRLVIDHGFGVVIGETSEIGDDVTLYQGVTLGGIAPSVNSKSQVNVKRHPSLRNNVIVGSGAQILGPVTVGEGARVGANAVLTKDLAPGVTAVGIPAHAVLPQDRSAAGRFVAYGTPAGGCPDPVLETMETMRVQLAGLQERIGHLEQAAQANEPADAEDARWTEWRNDGGSAGKVAAIGDSGRR